MKVKILSSLENGQTFTGVFPKWIMDAFDQAAEDFANTNLEPNYRDVEIQIPIQVGQGPAKRTVQFDIGFPEPLINKQTLQPVCLIADNGFVQVDGKYRSLFLFRNRLFGIETAFISEESSEEAELLVKKEIFSTDTRLSRLRQEVNSLEMSITDSPRKRTAIPSYVRLAVYNRDKGECANCGSKESLHFDHILPVVKGGSNDEKNIQLLCETCNWTKSDRVDG